ncbi:MAG: NAD(P)-dependent oxidoreductase [Pseudonocardia sp.]|uniref:NAD(P)-dependent oxidoreductase n=1 Tax=unclassified Pseudonocardia TaxID=2619320 RepID=UPI0008697486|nr:MULTISPECIES: NAD(P)-dependent oxidoreductase [unclassified Pseudonocardia]MBN9111387.1 NAD(P)-dependent oxidoreductase [Pseudonocardia sp.]ODU22828.1 MAG: oxidoreductase [Pseudonocardia sp. SCN 72-51]ODV05810.1 MAG: oxidoreductase [Pseudonocardia sp. SCN 73-27]
MTDVAVLGLGAMGLPTAARLVGPFTVSGFDVSPERRELADGSGVRSAASPAEAVVAGGIALLAVRDEAQVRESLFGADGAAAALGDGGLVVLTSTIGPAAARALASELADAGIALVDAPVSGGPARAGAGDLLIVVGGSGEALDRARQVLDRLASTLAVVGEHPGDGQSMKTVNQLLAGVHIAAAAEAVALARGLGLDPGTVVSTLSAGAAGSFMLADRGPRMVAAYEVEDVEVRSRLDIFVKDMGIVTDAGRTARVPLPLAAAAQQLYLLGHTAGMDARDDSSVVTLLSPPPTER